MRILLVQPGFSDGVGFRLVASPEPLHLEMIAATVPEHEVRILDMRIDTDLKSTLRQFQPEMVAVTALTPEVATAQSILDRVKAFSPEVFTVVGGHHATLLPQDFSLPQVDAIAIGDGEMVFASLVRTMANHRSLDGVPNIVWQDSNGTFIWNDRSNDRVDLGTLTMPRRDLTAAYRDDYFFLFDRPDTSVATSRGCPFRCSFCSVHEFHRGAINQMPPERVLSEIAAVPTDHVTFVDDNFLMNSRRETAIAEMIQAEGIRKRYSMECRTDSIVRHPELVKKWVDIGLYAVLLGLEGNSDSMLKNVSKSCTIDTNNRAIEILQDNGVIIWGAFIVDPDWTADDFKRLHDYVRQKRITHTQFTVLTPLPGTQLYRERRHELLTDEYSCFDTLHAVVPTRLPREEFYQHFASLYRQTDIGPYYDLVQTGKITIEDCRRGKKMLDALADWERYIEKDPILGHTGVTSLPAGRGT
ncbi:MAG TPA: radical SAM protein [Sedimentisphaerales bacterium]|nr:radical SAM protein [Sedimentisphaerales bacterium]HQG48142.1 radical SAM protein [Sedimentisphaerales bacterium]HQI27668.1 radical SAM protein [Sedimentisphaerales bacterium]